MIRFCFELRPLDEVSPWGGDHPKLHWFGLTEGWYWIEAGGHQLLRRSRRDLLHPCVDYYLARLWEDVNVLSPQVLEPVPTDLQPFIASDCTLWARDPLEFIADGGEDEIADINQHVADHPVVTASNWYGEHFLDFGYLQSPPELRLWRTVDADRDEITMDWWHDDESSFVAGQALQVKVPTAAYVSAVHALDQELMTAMRQRIEELERRGGLPDVDVDLAGLRREHEDRAHWLARSLDRSPGTDWKEVREGARLLLADSLQDDARRPNPDPQQP